MKLLEVLKDANEISDFGQQLAYIAESEFEADGHVGNLDSHACGMGVVYHVDSEGNFSGCSADWVECSRNGYSQKNVAKILGAVCRVVRMQNMGS